MKIKKRLEEMDYKIMIQRCDEEIARATSSLLINSELKEFAKARIEKLPKSLRLKIPKYNAKQELLKRKAERIQNKKTA